MIAQGVDNWKVCTQRYSVVTGTAILVQKLLLKVLIFYTLQGPL